ncbi:MAG: hypothetical protein CBD16_03090 [Betaproteobacteria bacterium TMED156]|nr:MAG: hypothetical protein CBD16_03090 [Betaproteobacteria bacterium TMED156]
MKVCIIGAGSIGGIVAVRLSHLCDLTVVLRGANLSAVTRNGIRLITKSGESKKVRVKTVESLAGLSKQDLIVLSVKAHQIKILVNDIKKIIHNKTIILTMQNGIPWWYFCKLDGPFNNYHLNSVDPKGFILSNINSDLIIGTVIYMASQTIKPGIIKSNEEEKIAFGELDGSTSERLKKICNLFTEAGFKANLKTDIRSEIWLKLWGNSSFNPVSALTHNTLLDICKSKFGKELILKMCYEIQKVGEYFGAQFSISMEERVEVAKNVGHHKTSMLQDIEYGKDIELDALLGSVIELGEIAKIQTPHLKSIYACCNLLQNKIKSTCGRLKIDI